MLGGEQTKARARPAGTPHPLDPLTPRRSAWPHRSCASSAGERWLALRLDRAARAVQADGPRLRRRRPRSAARRVVACWNRDDGQVFEAVIALGEDRVVSWTHQSDGQPNMTV